MIKVIVLLSAAALVYSRPKDDDSIHVVYPKMLSEIEVPSPEPRSGVAYVYSIPISEVTHHEPDESNEGTGEASPVNESEIVFKEVTVSKRVGFHKEGSKQTGKEKVQPDVPTDPLDPVVNES